MKAVAGGQMARLPAATAAARRRLVAAAEKVTSETKN